MLADKDAVFGHAEFQQIAGDCARMILLVRQQRYLGLAVDPLRKPFQAAAVRAGNKGILPALADSRKSELKRADLRIHLHPPGKLSRQIAADTVKQRIAGCQHHCPAVFRLKLLRNLAQPPLKRDCFSPKIREKLQLPFSSDEHLSPFDPIDIQFRQSRRSVIADSNNGNRFFHRKNSFPARRFIHRFPSSCSYVPAARPSSR
ncbi:Uncharacterised protein [Mycobacterium tuberculosis]|nr:Uncharacterised protein [Mycobacterium tuberculosis]